MHNYSKTSSVVKRGPSLKVQFSIDHRGITEIKLFDRKSEVGLEWEVLGLSPSPFLKELIEKWLESYSKKRRPEVVLPLILDGLPPYTTRVLSILRDIPFGISLSYKELAEITGTPQGARAVGNACSRNLFPLVIPCHRVLTTGSGIGGFSGGIEVKRKLLVFEGINCK